MAWTLIAKDTGISSGAGTTTDQAGTFNISDGDAVIILAKTEASNTYAAAKDSGSPANNFTFDANDFLSYAGGGATAAIGYLVGAAADGSLKIRMTTQSSSFKRFVAFHLRPDSGDTVGVDQRNKSSGTGSSATSGNITTTSTDLAAVALYADFDGLAPASGETINGSVGDDRAGVGTDFSAWVKLFTSTFTGQAAATPTGSAQWACLLLSLKSEAPAAGVTVAWLQA
jgi:hypothetical protein